MKLRATTSKLFLPLFLILFLFQACDKNDPAPASPNDHVDSWIYENMQFWYYWSSQLPASPDKTLAPDEFFKSLLSTDDRFSWIQENFTDLLNSLRGVSKEAGFEFALYRESQDNNNVIAQILYVKPNSPASSAGLKRGDIISKINSTQITTDNYKDLAGKLTSNHSLTFRPVDIESKTLGTEQTINIVPVEYAENPNYMNTVLTYGDRKIGYYVYNLFSEGASGTSKEYTQQMDNIFASFQSQGITDLVIDLRFNSGGAETAAQNLASLIGKNITSTTTFVRHEYNEGVTNEIKASPNLGEGYLTVPFLSKTQNIGSQLRDGRVYILTGSRTASASELIINGLKPFMDVYLVGGTTYGKNVASISIYDEEDPDNKWGMQPIVAKLFNNQNQSDYSNGFTPQIQDQDNSFYLYPLGDPRESLLNKALTQITGQSGIARQAETEKAGDLLFHSLDIKRRSGIVTVDLPH
ncbi:MAG TPA: S41 family peptidase [Cyclobacteriaceae bacterium]|nr:S41 family peptidase [Cyclobacteriaceae bacterium]